MVLMQKLYPDPNTLCMERFPELLLASMEATDQYPNAHLQGQRMQWLLGSEMKTSFNQRSLIRENGRREKF